MAVRPYGRRRRRTERTHDRRASNRLPIERDVHYKVLGEKETVKQVGSGKSLNMSSGGVLFTTESGLREGERIEPQKPFDLVQPGTASGSEMEAETATLPRL